MPAPRDYRETSNDPVRTLLRAMAQKSQHARPGGAGDDQPHLSGMAQRSDDSPARADGRMGRRAVDGTFRKRFPKRRRGMRPRQVQAATGEAARRAQRAARVLATHGMRIGFPQAIVLTTRTRGAAFIAMLRLVAMVVTFAAAWWLVVRTAEAAFGGSSLVVAGVVGPWLAFNAVILVNRVLSASPAMRAGRREIER